MSDNAAEMTAGEGAAAPDTFVDGGDELSLQDAMALYGQSEPKEPDEGADDATPVEESEAKADDADPEKDPGETQEADAEKEPPIERPRSWAKDEDAEWNSLPRAMQQKIVARESERDRGIAKSQQEAAETRKAAEAARTAAEEAQRKYEARLPELEQALQNTYGQEFSDIKSMEDVQKISNAIGVYEREGKVFEAQQLTNYLTRWRVFQDQLADVARQKQAAETRKATQEQTDWNTYVQKQNELAREHIPELADKDKGDALMKRAAERLVELGFTQDELSKLATGKEKISVFDHRFQRLINSDLRLQDIQNAPKAVVKKDLPPVQRPGAAQPKGAQASANLQALEKQFERSGSVDDAFALMQARTRRVS